MNRIQCALKMAQAGWPVFPLVPGGKEPYAGEGVTFASTDPARIRAWFVQRPDMNYGVDATGRLVIDIDNKGGKRGGAEFARLVGAPPATLSVRTPNHGLHLYFDGDGTDYSQSALGDGVDVRAYHGYVVGPGSAVAAGTYQIARDIAAAPVPAAIAALLRAVAPEQYLPREQRQLPIGELDTDAAIAAGIRYLTTDAPTGEQGARNETGFRVACVLKDLGLSADRIGDLMAEHWTCDLGDDFGAADLYELGARAHKSGRYRPGVASAENEFADLLGEDAALATVLGEADAAAADEMQARRDALLAEMSAKFQPAPLHVDPRDVPRRRWFVKDVLSPGLLTGIVAPPGVGKSTFVLNLAAGLTVGDLGGLGFECPEGAKRVLFVSVEDDPLTQYGRTWAAYEAHGLDMAAGAPNLLLPTEKFERMTLLARVKGGLQRTEDVAGLALLCQQQQIDVLVLDPWVDMSEGDENSNGDVQRAVSVVRDMCRRLDMAGVIVHHSRKVLSDALERASDANSVRGAGALPAALRMLFMLARPSEEEAAAKMWSEDEALAHFRFERAKGSYSPPGRNSRYYKQISVLRPCDRNGSVESEPAIIHVDTQEAEAEARRQYADLIAARMAENDLEIMKFGEAVDAVLACPICEGMGAATVKRVLDRLFNGAGVVIDDWRIYVRQMGASRVFAREVTGVSY